MLVIARLLALLENVEDAEGSVLWDLSHLHQRATEHRLFKMRPIRLRSALLTRIELASEALSLSHALKRIYTSFRFAISGLTTPLLSCLKKTPGTIQWGGHGCYFEIPSR